MLKNSKPTSKASANMLLFQIKRYDCFFFGRCYKELVKDMVHILDGNSEHVAHA